MVHILLYISKKLSNFILIDINISEKFDWNYILQRKMNAFDFVIEANAFDHKPMYYLYIDLEDYEGLSMQIHKDDAIMHTTCMINTVIKKVTVRYAVTLTLSDVELAALKNRVANVFFHGMSCKQISDFIVGELRLICLQSDSE